MKLLLKLSYDGSFFNGSQVQPGLPTVQGSLCDAAREIFGFSCDVTGCSRTDAGVHARSWCASVFPSSPPEDTEAWCPVPVDKACRAFNAKLPPAMSAVAAASVPDTFHPRYDVVYKEYEYLICDSPERDPFLIGRAWQTGRRIDDGALYRMREAASTVVGKKDFRCFMASGSDVKDTVRNVSMLSVGRTGPDTLLIRIRADGFLYNMVRIIAGTLVDAAFGRIDPAAVGDIIASGDRTRAGQTAPAGGLYLSAVDYGGAVDWMTE